ncbi:ectonucleoside triphosphate diphosphohydrolase 5 [Lates japonicus]|uniref:Ectonucleoside triphosphate diphosphohydrolase 5 n=1 Tax=Lates japonicus TaxID=270547 RepID=A0AAD3NM19_LATJO|nr:ectonucleoside triphosphate diphosphohydrolase 5 [Lates japonicus]
MLTQWPRRPCPAWSGKRTDGLRATAGLGCWLQKLRLSWTRLKSADAKAFNMCLKVNLLFGPQTTSVTILNGTNEGYAGFKLCYQEVLKVVKGIIHQPYELEDINVFYAFSYYYDRAVMVSKEGCWRSETSRRELRRLTKKVNNVEASWALGATLDHFHNLKIH